MAYNGSGVFTRLYSWVDDRDNGVKIRADRMDAEFDGIATGLSTAILKDGTQTITADIPWNGNKITGLGDPTSAQDAATKAYVDGLTGVEFSDSTFRIQDNGDATKELAFEVSGITTGTTRTWTVPDANITFGAYAPTLLNVADEAGFKSAVNLEIGTDVQAYSSNLDSFSGISPGAYASTLLSVADEASFKTAVNLEIGTDVQAYSATLGTLAGASDATHLTDIAGLSLSDGDIFYVASSAVTRLAKGTAAQVLTMNAGATAPEWADASGGQWELLDTVSFTAAASYEWTWTGRYAEIWLQVFAANPPAADLVIYYDSDGGASYDTGYNFGTPTGSRAYISAIIRTVPLTTDDAHNAVHCIADLSNSDGLIFNPSSATDHSHFISHDAPINAIKLAPASSSFGGIAGFEGRVYGRNSY